MIRDEDYPNQIQIIVDIEWNSRAKQYLVVSEVEGSPETGVATYFVNEVLINMLNDYTDDVTCVKVEPKNSLGIFAFSNQAVSVVFNCPKFYLCVIL